MVGDDDVGKATASAAARPNNAREGGNAMAETPSILDVFGVVGETEKEGIWARFPAINSVDSLQDLVGS